MEVTQVDSIWPPIHQMIAHAYSMWNVRFPSVLTQLAIFVFYALAGTRKDLLFNLSIFAYMNASALSSYVLLIIPYIYFPFLCLAMGQAGYLALATRSNFTSTWSGPGRPYLIPCRTTHTRLFPKKHSFSYSYLTIGIPIGFEGNVNGMIGVNEKSISTIWDRVLFASFFFQSWYSVRASDHLQRGHDELGLRGKLDLYLKSEGLNPTDFPHAYLVTAARFAGYQFNPVSFWYLYSSDRKLSAMILEVNNTYNERRPYLVHRVSTAEVKTPDSRPSIKGYRVKDFYVSPFNSRKGHYTVLASDPLGTGMVGFNGIDVKITLNSSKGHPKLVARLFSERKPIDPSLLGTLSKLVFLARWFWVGFVTVPRIVKEAIILLYRRKLEMREKPAPLLGTLGRHSISTEKVLERCFRRYLEFLVHHSKRPLLVKYNSSGFISKSEEFSSSSYVTSPDAKNVLELRVLTPSFYSRFVQYDDGLDGITSELINHKTIWINKPELTQHIFTPLSVTSRSQSYSDSIFTALTRNLRRSPLEAPIDSDPIHPPRTFLPARGAKDVHAPLMEAFMVCQADGGLKRQYQWASFRQLFADWCLMGRVDLLDGGIHIVRMGIAWKCVSFVNQYGRDY